MLNMPPKIPIEIKTTGDSPIRGLIRFKLATDIIKINVDARHDIFVSRPISEVAQNQANRGFTRYSHEAGGAEPNV